MYIDRSRPSRFDAAELPSTLSVGAKSAPSRIVMHQAIDEDGNSVRVASIVPRYQVAGDGFQVIEGLPQWFTERGERLALLCDSHFEVVGTQRKLRVIESSQAS